jgi:hypothetical protein
MCVATGASLALNVLVSGSSCNTGYAASQTVRSDLAAYVGSFTDMIVSLPAADVSCWFQAGVRRGGGGGGACGYGLCVGEWNKVVWRRRGLWTGGCERAVNGGGLNVLMKRGGN